MIYEYYMTTLAAKICSEDLLDFEFDTALSDEYCVDDSDKAYLAYELATKWAKEIILYSRNDKYYVTECIYKDIIELI